MLYWHYKNWFNWTWFHLLMLINKPIHKSHISRFSRFYGPLCSSLKKGFCHWFLLNLRRLPCAVTVHCNEGSFYHHFPPGQRALIETNVQQNEWWPKQSEVYHSIPLVTGTIGCFLAINLLDSFRTHNSKIMHSQSCTD